MHEQVFQELARTSITSQADGRFEIKLPTVTKMVNSVEEIHEFFSVQPLSTFLPLLLADIVIKNEIEEAGEEGEEPTIVQTDEIIFQGHMHCVFVQGIARLQELLEGAHVDLVDTTTGARLNLTENLVELGIPALAVATWVPDPDAQAAWLEWFFTGMQENRLVMELKTEAETGQIPLRLVDLRKKESGVIEEKASEDALPELLE